MRSYKTGSATESYQEQVRNVYEIVKEIEKKKPKLYERAQRMAARYSRKLAEYYNSYYRNEASCPSVMITGAGNFPVGKKNKQNERRETLLNDWNYLESYARKIEGLLTMNQPILSNDEQAIELLEEKLEALKEKQENMKAVNKAIKKKDVAVGNEELRDMGYSDNDIAELRKPDFAGRVGYPGFSLQNNLANIKRVEARLKKLKAVKADGTKEVECEFFKVIENTDLMRLQLIFDDKPSEELRKVLKSYAFRWSPSNKSWQRQLTDNAKRVLHVVINEINALDSIA
nr:MAG TPA: protein of unknown function (DUF3560) [Caudoviricetes sp.]